MNDEVMPSLDTFSSRGWIRLASQFDETALAALSVFGPHVGNGRRLSNLSEIHDVLPTDLKLELQTFGLNPTPQRAVGFTKTQTDNWALPWHQDRVIVMDERVSDPTLKNWSRKSGQWHCEPPAVVLEDMAFAYIAFDAVGSGAGGLEIAEGTHRFGKIDAADIGMRTGTSTCVSPALERGEALLVSALTLHRSAALGGCDVRRALRLDFARSL